MAGPRVARAPERRAGASRSTTPAFPFMACGEVAVGGVAARLFRISFSGEQAYELAVPARYGAALWRAPRRAGAALGGGAYGLEALNVLRIEKGLLTHAELHGRTTADDLGLGADGGARQGLHRQGRRRAAGARRRRSASSSSGLRPRGAGGPAPRRRARGRAPAPAFTAGERPRLPHLRLPLADPRPRHRARLRPERPRADRRAGPGGLPRCAASTALRDRRPGLPRSGRGAAPWLTSRPKAAFDGLALPLAAGGATLAALPASRARAVAPFAGRHEATSETLAGADRRRAAAPGSGRAARSPGPAIGQWLVEGASRPSSPPASPASPRSPTRPTPGRRCASPAPAPRDVLARLVPLDLDPARFPAGSAARSLLRHVPLLLLAREAGFDLLVPRSYARTAVHELAAAMRAVAARRGARR